MMMTVRKRLAGNSQAKRAAQRQGAATVEFALCLPVLLALIFAMIEFSGAAQLQNSVRMAAFEGARAGLALNATASTATQAAQNACTAAGIKSPVITVNPAVITPSTPTIQVTVQVQPSVEGWAMWYITAGTTITSTITLDREAKAISVVAAGRDQTLPVLLAEQLGSGTDCDRDEFTSAMPIEVASRELGSEVRGTGGLSRGHRKSSAGWMESLRVCTREGSPRFRAYRKFDDCCSTSA